MGLFYTAPEPTRGLADGNQHIRTWEDAGVLLNSVIYTVSVLPTVLLKSTALKPRILHVEQQRRNDFVHVHWFPDVTLQVVSDGLAYNTLKPMQAGKSQPTNNTRCRSFLKTIS